MIEYFIAPIQRIFVIWRYEILNQLKIKVLLVYLKKESTTVVKAVLNSCIGVRQDSIKHHKLWYYDTTNCILWSGYQIDLSNLSRVNHYFIFQNGFSVLNFICLQNSLALLLKYCPLQLKFDCNREIFSCDTKLSVVSICMEMGISQFHLAQAYICGERNIVQHQVAWK